MDIPNLFCTMDALPAHSASRALPGNVVPTKNMHPLPETIFPAQHPGRSAGVPGRAPSHRSRCPGVADHRGLLDCRLHGTVMVPRNCPRACFRTMPPIRLPTASSFPVALVRRRPLLAASVTWTLRPRRRTITVRVSSRVEFDEQGGLPPGHSLDPPLARSTPSTVTCCPGKRTDTGWPMSVVPPRLGATKNVRRATKRWRRDPPCGKKTRQVRMRTQRDGNTAPGHAARCEQRSRPGLAPTCSSAWRSSWGTASCRAAGPRPVVSRCVR